SEFAVCVLRVCPAEETSDACARGASPVTYTCLALPTARKAGVAAEACANVVRATTSETLIKMAHARALRRVVVRIDIPCCLAGPPACVGIRAVPGSVLLRHRFTK